MNDNNKNFVVVDQRKMGDQKIIGEGGSDIEINGDENKMTSTDGESLSDAMANCKVSLEAGARATVDTDDEHVASSLPHAASSFRSGEVLLCDAGYGLPRETKPRREKINAIASQLSNFLKWQMDPTETVNRPKDNYDPPLAEMRIVGCPDEATKYSLEKRLLEVLDMTQLPPHVTLSCVPLEEAAEETISKTKVGNIGGGTNTCVYLSPDADEALDPCVVPPSTVVVGLLIDRRIQLDRSKNRADKLGMVAKRWPLESCFANVSATEPLNVDCILEGMQQWWWNCDQQIVDLTMIGETRIEYKPLQQKDLQDAFLRAASQAIEHHACRHPSRPLHITATGNKEGPSADTDT